SVRWLSKIVLEFLPTVGLAFIDESNRNVNSLQQHTLGVGIPKNLPKIYASLLLECHRILLGHHKRKILLKNNKELSESIRLEENKQAITSKEILEECKEIILKEMMDSSLIKMNEDEKIIYRNYLLDKKVSKPQQLVDLYKNNPDRARLICLLRYYLDTLLPFSIRLVETVDHGPSTNVFEEFETPRYRTSASKNQYTDPFVTWILSIK
ncbi:MAG: hypothetical protein Q8K60_08660, partial [Parachlamydiaceae bacterium]|nr:hypothetical protein [Parachlamydiaceae bacterium]